MGVNSHNREMKIVLEVTFFSRLINDSKLENG